MSDRPTRAFAPPVEPPDRPLTFVLPWKKRVCFRRRSVYITACNIKKLDTKFYNIERPRCWVTVSHGDKKYTTQVGIGLDPEWEEETFFEIADPETDKIGAEFFIKCEKNGNEQMLGDAQSYALNKLLKGKQTYKGLVVPGGKADMMFTAMDFGDEEAAE